jgi:hypothetical protein
MPRMQAAGTWTTVRCHPSHLLGKKMHQLIKRNLKRRGRGRGAAGELLAQQLEGWLAAVETPTVTTAAEGNGSSGASRAIISPYAVLASHSTHRAVCTRPCRVTDPVVDGRPDMRATPTQVPPLRGPIAPSIRPLCTRSASLSLSLSLF